MAATDVCCLFNGIPALAFTLQCAHSRRSSGVAILMAAPSELENLGRNYNRLRGDLGICKAYQLTLGTKVCWPDWKCLSPTLNSCRFFETLLYGSLM